MKKSIANGLWRCARLNSRQVVSGARARPRPAARNCGQSSLTPRCQDPSVRRQSVDSPTAGSQRADTGLECHAHPRTTDRDARRPPLGNQAPMPAQQRCQRDDERLPTRGRNRLATASSTRSTAVMAGRRVVPKDREFVAEDDDFSSGIPSIGRAAHEFSSQRNNT